MNLFRSTPTPDDEGFYDTGVMVDSLQPHQMTKVKLGGRPVVLTRYEGELYAFSAVCPHAAADLSEGTLYRYKVCCPDHEYCFDIRDGRILWPQDEPYGLRRYPVKEENGIVKVRLT